MGKGGQPRENEPPKSGGQVCQTDMQPCGEFLDLVGQVGGGVGTPEA